MRDYMHLYTRLGPGRQWLLFWGNRCRLGGVSGALYSVRSSSHRQCFYLFVSGKLLEASTQKHILDKQRASVRREKIEIHFTFIHSLLFTYTASFGRKMKQERFPELGGMHQKSKQHVEICLRGEFHVKDTFAKYTNR
jgi:hypothetical protein